MFGGIFKSVGKIVSAPFKILPKPLRTPAMIGAAIYTAGALNPGVVGAGAKVTALGANTAGAAAAGQASAGMAAAKVGAAAAGMSTATKVALGTYGLSTAAGLKMQHSAGKVAKELAAGQLAAINKQGVEADRIARDQRLQQDKALQKISMGRVKSSQRRIRGGLFGDAANADSQYAASAKLGG